MKRQDEIITELSSQIVRILTETAVEILKADGPGKLELARILLGDAVRYDSSYPHARAGGDTFLKAIKALRNGNAINDGDR